MGGGISSLFATTAAPEQQQDPEDADKPGLLYPGKEAFHSAEFTRWCLSIPMEICFEKFAELEDNCTERTFLALLQPLEGTTNGTTAVERWNNVKISPARKYLKAFILDYDPTEKDSGKENFVVYSYLVQAQYASQVEQWLQTELDTIRSAGG